MAPTTQRKQTAEYLALSLSVLALCYLLYHTLAGGTLLSPAVYDNYGLQAQNWLQGRIDIENGASYTWLELAIYDGKYYVSFPPFPSLLSLPFVWAFGFSPANLLIALYAMIAFIAAFGCFRTFGCPTHLCGFWAVFFTYATNLTELSRTGGVWNQAQVLNLALCMLAVWCMAADRKNLSLILFALAVGCRPFSAIYLLGAGIYYLLEGRRTLKHTLFSLLPGILSVTAIAAAMTAYNFVRFDSPLEFGHNYLPEFTQSVYGQFHPSYIIPNFLQLFRLPSITSSLLIEFPLFNGFLFFLVNPVFLVWGIRMFSRRLWREQLPAALLSLLTFTAILLALCAHKTMGGWQFGARYTVDLLPAALIGLSLTLRQDVRIWERFLCFAGIAINVFGAVFMLIQEMS